MKCSVVNCQNEIMEGSKVECCFEHEQGVIDFLEEEGRAQQTELYNDWRRSQ